MSYGSKTGKEGLAEAIVQGLKESGIDFVAVMPESTMLGAVRIIEKDKSFTFVQVSNESTGAAICAGAWMGGKKPVLMMESPGFLVSSYALARLLLLFGTPVLLLISHRGDAGDAVWWSHFSGPALRPTLEALEIQYINVNRVEDAAPALKAAATSLEVEENPRAVILGGGLFG